MLIATHTHTRTHESSTATCTYKTSPTAHIPALRTMVSPTSPSTPHSAVPSPEGITEYIPRVHSANHEICSEFLNHSFSLSNHDILHKSVLLPPTALSSAQSMFSYLSPHPLEIYSLSLFHSLPNARSLSRSLRIFLCQRMYVCLFYTDASRAAVVLISFRFCRLLWFVH